MRRFIFLIRKTMRIWVWLFRKNRQFYIANSREYSDSKMLLVEPEQRFSVTQCLNHEFFRAVARRDSVKEEGEKFNPRKTFRLAIIMVRFLVRLQRLKATPEPLSLRTASSSPYSMRMFRKVIDGAAFRVYGHWVKRGEGQNMPK